MIADTIPAGDLAVLVAWAAGGAAVSGGLAWWGLRALRGRPLRTQIAVAGLAPVACVAVGVIGASEAMFISGHDLRALFVVTIAAGAVAVVTGIVLGAEVASASRSLSELVHQIGDDAAGGALGAAGGRAPAELAAVRGELEATAARLAESWQRAESLEQSRRELVAWVSHDLRTPMAGIRAMAEALEDGVVADPATVARYHRTISTEAERLAGLVDDLFELSRIQAGALALAIERVPLQDLLSDALAGASIAAGAKGVDLRGAVAEPSPVVELSAPEIARVVRNLLDNAIRHTPPGGVVEVAADIDGDAAVVSVRDACGGIPDADIDRVFDLAYRGDAARTPGHDGGAGLGLAVARGLVEAHHGEIAVANESPGCRFTVRLPLVHASPAG